MERDAAAHDAWALTGAVGIAGFAVAARRPPGGAEILWIAVDLAGRGRGQEPGSWAAFWTIWHSRGASMVVAETLDRSAGYPPYEATRGFWERRGFAQVDTIDPLPGWQPGNPAAIYVAALRPTRRRAPD
jgi:hypothetical protein